MDHVITDVVRRIWKEQHAIEVEPNNDLDFVTVRTTNKAAEEYFGRIMVVLSTDVARAVAMAMLACADEIDKSKT